ncbi:uncharacterized protein MELLADRAFT_106042 [Melampsora larici-populina 98AG31]|uniref:Uncharacterized protein n=1 Tax=Melampsora larici-populina (strain 98AG31 / pathotype 3-4-7) TaxID=747676 RepID=F4RK64_MELLP|nr:uncharacterized protein MELLADRAFT_106042 [Melampsora larici-populina 98AG31]EGG07042.1 hypothetical protein MELLADRAFT_106042 [Melampsora larici-populina 98AG31]
MYDMGGHLPSEHLCQSHNAVNQYMYPGCRTQALLFQSYSLQQRQSHRLFRDPRKPQFLDTNGASFPRNARYYDTRSNRYIGFKASDGPFRPGNRIHWAEDGVQLYFSTPQPGKRNLHLLVILSVALEVLQTGLCQVTLSSKLALVCEATGWLRNIQNHSLAICFAAIGFRSHGASCANILCNPHHEAQYFVPKSTVYLGDLWDSFPADVGNNQCNPMLHWHPRRITDNWANLVCLNSEKLFEHSDDHKKNQNNKPIESKETAIDPHSNAHTRSGVHVLTTATFNERFPLVSLVLPASSSTDTSSGVTCKGDGEASSETLRKDTSMMMRPDISNRYTATITGGIHN